MWKKSYIVKSAIAGCRIRKHPREEGLVVLFIVEQRRSTLSGHVSNWLGGKPDISAAFEMLIALCNLV